MKLTEMFFFIVCIMIATLLWSFSVHLEKAHGMDLTPDYYGVSAFHGTSNMALGLGPEALEKTTWTSVSGLVGYEWKPWMHFQSSLGPGYIQTKSQDTPTAELTLTLHFPWECFYFNVNGGGAYLFNSSGFKELESSWLYGTFGFGVGIQLADDIDLGYRFKHISSPFHNGRDCHDTGLNVGMIELKWDF